VLPGRVETVVACGRLGHDRCATMELRQARGWCQQDIDLPSIKRTGQDVDDRRTPRRRLGVRRVMKP
jgi:hypothetical protein